MPDPINFHSGLQLTYFKVQKLSPSGTWVSTNSLRKNNRYRFRLKFYNSNSSTYLIPRVPPHTEQHVWLDLHGIDILVSDAEFYKDSSFTGQHAANRTDKDGGRIGPNKSKVYYFYFIWRGPHDSPMPIPGVRITTNLAYALGRGNSNRLLVPMFSI